MKFKKLFWQLATLAGIFLLFANPISKRVLPSIVSIVDAREIYPMFTCPCCDQPLNKEKPCCGSAVQMIDFIDQKTSTGASKDEIILATAQEFGLERLADENQRGSLKDKLLANAPKNAPRISLAQTKADLGTVSQTKGIVTTEFTLENKGKTALVIDKLSSSCGCTSASLVYQGKEGPKFSMPGHGQEEPDPNWQVAVASGDQAQIKVYYDPMVHADLTGPVTRTVSVHSNDPVDFETKLTITLNQTK
ncbi:MAG: DUF1573 domain-containing protein [Patescibacteria group bacterium]|nr:DUF1573 domain-containing protein [Patescibacteria group bacterium]